MAYTAKLERESKFILIDGSGPYKLKDKWVPPTNALNQALAGGTSASAYIYPEVISERVQPAEITVDFVVSGSSTLDIKQSISRLNSFLRDAGNDNRPTYFSWKPDDLPSPTWGQDVRRLRISKGYAVYGDLYGTGSLSANSVPNCTLYLTVTAIEGRNQDLLSVLGAVYDDYYPGATSPRGLSVCAANGSVNYIDNPKFGASTWSTGWAAGGTSTAVVSQNTNKANIVRGSSSADVTFTGTSQSSWFAFDAIGDKASLGVNLTFMAWVKTDSSDVKLFFECNYPTTQVLSSAHSGSGEWERLILYVPAVTFDTGGTTSYINLGVYSEEVAQCYLDCAHLRASNGAIPYFDGDELGCSWSGTAENSTSSSYGAARARISDDYVRLSEGTFSTIWYPYDESTISATFDLGLWASDGATVSKLVYDTGNKRFELTIGATVVNGATFNFSPGDCIIIHGTWKPGDGVKLYVNGVQSGSTGTYAAFTTANYIYLGSSYTTSPANRSAGPVSVEIYDQAFTSGNVATDYNNKIAVANRNESPCSMPWVWTIDGDGVIDSSTDSTNAAYAIIGGVTGDIPVPPELILNVSSTYYDVFIGQYEADIYIPQSQFWRNGTPTSVTNSWQQVAGNGTVTENYKDFADRPVTLFVGINDAGTGTLSVRVNTIMTVTIDQTETDTIDPPSSGYYAFEFTGLQVPKIDFQGDFISAATGFTIDCLRSVASAANVTVNGLLWFNDLLFIHASLISGTAYDSIAIINGKTFARNSGSSYVIPMTAKGPIPYLHPNKVNHFFAATTVIQTATWNSATIARISIKPRYLNA